MTVRTEVSVIIPTYNRAERINRAISSVLQQTFEDLEIIVVDDGSTENIRGVIENFHSQKIVYMRHENNLGVSAARNTGMRAAKGKYIAWLDSDDEWLPSKLERQVTAMDKARDNVGLCCTGYYLSKGKVFRKIIPFYSGSWLRSLLLRCDLPGPIIFFKKSVLDAVGYLDESLLRYEDWDWLIRCAKHYDFLVVEEPLMVFMPSSDASPEIVERSALRFIEKHLDDFAAFGRSYFTKTLLAHPFNYPEAYFGLLDTYLDTRLFQWALNMKDRLIDLLYVKKFRIIWF
jgi:glycosyltransferase involved in cell wall biosynthesis